MKKILFVTLMLFVFPFAGCKFDDCSDMIWDFVNYNVDFQVTDEAGNDLLNPETENNITGNDISVEYKGEVFKIKTETKANMPLPLGLRMNYYGTVPVYLLSFGEFAPDVGYKNETFIVDWGDGTRDQIKFDLEITWKKCKPTIHKTIYLNDKIYSNESFLIKIIK
jgi:hypothetical protein